MCHECGPTATEYVDDGREDKREGIDRLCAQMRDMWIVSQLGRGPGRGYERMLTEREREKQEEALARIKERHEEEALARKNGVEIFRGPICKMCEGPMRPRSGPMDDAVPHDLSLP